MTTTAAPTTGPAPRHASASDAVPTASRARLDAVDLVRGLVIAFMLLDHTRDFVHSAAMTFQPTDLDRTNVPLFLTRWITHFCAPVFVFLAGTGAYLQLMRGKPMGELRRFLVTRGLWLVLVEIAIVRVAAFWYIPPSQILLMLEVIWAIGLSMICLAALTYLPVRTIGAFGVLLIVLHNTLDGVLTATPWRGPGSPVPGIADKLISVLHQPGVFPIAGWPGPLALVMYPLVPWVGVLAAGYAFGRLYTLDADRRRTILVRLGVALTVAFVALRLANLYGDPVPWTVQRSAAFTVLSFLDLQKYPPSLLYLLMTLGPAILLLGLVDRFDVRATRVRLARWLTTFGRVPLFFFVMQWPVAHAMGLLVGLVAGESVTHFTMHPPNPPIDGPPSNVGGPLWVVYLTWLAGLALLYPLCRWFAAVKARRRDWWLGYL
jgi:uncharacterized membrane protein